MKSINIIIALMCTSPLIHAFGESNTLTKENLKPPLRKAEVAFIGDSQNSGGKTGGPIEYMSLDADDGIHCHVIDPLTGKLKKIKMGSAEEATKILETVSQAQNSTTHAQTDQKLKSEIDLDRSEIFSPADGHTPLY